MFAIILLNGRLTRNANHKKQTKDATNAPHKSPKTERSDLTSLNNKTSNVNNIDEDAWKLCSKAWQLIETPLEDDGDGIYLHDRLANIQVS